MNAAAEEVRGKRTAFILMLFLYFIVGLFTTINQQLQIPLQVAMLPHSGTITNALVTLLNFTWFLAYPISEGFATRWVNRFGYRKTSLYALFIFLSGLGIYELAVLLSIYHPFDLSILGNQISIGFFIFLAGSFVIGIAVTVLQVVTGLYLQIYPMKNTTAVQRQMIGGTTNSVGMAIGPLVVSYIIFSGIPLHQVQSYQFIWPLLGLMTFVLLITFLTVRIRLPFISATNERQIGLNQSVWCFSHLRLGVVGIFCYVGVEVAVGANINLYATQLGQNFALAATKMAALYWTGILVGRFLGSVYTRIPGQTQLVFASLGAVALLILSMLLKNPWLLVGTGLFHSVMWPAIYALALDKLGPYTAKASGVLMIGVVGGGIIPFLQGVLADILGGSWRWSWGLVVIGELYILYYGWKGYQIKQG